MIGMAARLELSTRGLIVNQYRHPCRARDLSCLDPDAIACE